MKLNFLLLFFYIFGIHTFSQNKVMIGDTIVVTISDYFSGKVQWKSSTDMLNWNDVKGATNEKLIELFDNPISYKASVENSKCEYYTKPLEFLVKSQLIEYPTDNKYSSINCKFQGIPTIIKTNDGLLWIAWYAGGTGEGPDNFVKLVVSSNDGIFWSNLIIVADPPMPVKAFDPCLWLSPDNEVYLFWSQHNYTKPTNNSAVYFSKCLKYQKDSFSWSFPSIIADGVMLNKPIVTSYNNWMLPIAVWGLASYVYTSTDNGKTFILVGSSQVPNRTFDEHMLVELKDKRFWELVRTNYGIGQTFSSDGCKTWSEGEPSGLVNADSRFHIRRLKSGNILLIHHNPPQKDMSRSYLTASLSTDEGKSWTYNFVLDERTGVSYPDAFQDKDGYIYITYDRNRYSDKEILLAKISEQDITTGIISTGSFLKRIVNHPDN